jgi:hypothetical protein
MNEMKNPNILLLGSVMFILLAIALVAILDKTTTNSNSGDVRARASTAQALTVSGTVSGVDEINRTVHVENVQLADTSRAGTAKNYGSWIVSTPQNFNFASISPGMRVSIGVDSSKFLVSTHTITAITISPAK